MNFKQPVVFSDGGYQVNIADRDQVARLSGCETSNTTAGQAGTPCPDPIASSRLLSIGMRMAEPGEEHITSDVPLRLKQGDMLIIDGMGDRLSWTGTFQNRKLAGILPSPRQQQEIWTFLQAGGTVLATAANPTVGASLAFYREELPAETSALAYQYPIEVRGDLAEILVPPFDWLPCKDWPLLRTAFDVFAAEKVQFQEQWETVGSLSLLKRATTRMIALHYGQGLLVVCPRDPARMLQAAKGLQAVVRGKGMQEGVA